MLNPLWLMLALVVLSLLPVIAGLFMCYLRVSIVLGLLRAGLGAQQVPSTLVVVSLSFALSLYVMAPVAEQSFEIAQQQHWLGLVKQPSLQALNKCGPVLKPWLEFIRVHTQPRELAASSILHAERGREQSKPEPLQSSSITAPNPPLQVMLPAFVLSELRQGFLMGFVLLLPFLVLDLIVANVLVGMGMYMVSPTMIALPLKLVLFVVADGWLLLGKGLISSYAV